MTFHTNLVLYEEQSLLAEISLYLIDVVIQNKRFILLFSLLNKSKQNYIDNKGK